MTKRRYRRSDPPAVGPAMAFFLLMVVGCLSIASSSKWLDWGSSICLGGLAVVAIALGYAIFENIRNRRERRALQQAMDLKPVRSPDELSPSDLEELAHRVYTRLGYPRVEHSGQHSSTDGGVDVWMLNQEQEVEVVQCKQLSTRVDRSVIRDFAKTIRQQHAARGHLWAPGEFTQPAIDFAREQGNITLCENGQIMALVDRAYPPPEPPAPVQAAPTPMAAKPFSLEGVLRSFASVLHISYWQAFTLIVIALTCGLLLAALLMLVLANSR